MTQIVTTVAAGQSVRVTLPLCRSGLGLGATVMTADGALPVEFLEPGDRVVTYDAGLQRLDRVTVRQIAACEAIRIRPSVMDDDNGRNLVISARQKLLIRDWRAEMIFGKKAALVEARRLADGAYFAPMQGRGPVRLFQLHFAQAQHVVHLGQGLLATSAAMPRKRVAQN
ncbi:Hint domain-containing protein [Maritimibacter sp. DP1N21-5]|uniref:Hint domain-containing protein n=1 Tax=Maritimibacter sp. DP1N21-5 TaxID=2836867 RepID=UPI001C4821F4|nr:Hint domain-containing protein [Maritimibacter sp. DP1N21-5]MBV7410087.1 Hint domain-containing protein [Maritimibacter sp. DP1N21-5]